LTHFIGDHGPVNRLIGNRSGIIGHSAIDGDIGADFGDFFAITHCIGRYASGGNQRASRFEEYQRPQLDPKDGNAQRIIVNDQLQLDRGTISLQSESHPIDFRKVEIMPLE
jgi:hypothetical protein